MTGVTGFIYHDEYLKYQFGPFHPFKSIKYKLTRDLVNELGMFDGKAKCFTPEPASEETLQLVHTRQYISFVQEMSAKGSGYLDYGDTPAVKGIYETSCFKVGGSVLGADLIMREQVQHAFNVGGGMHHAKPGNAAGFCIFNDVAIAARHLQKRWGLQRIVILDIDGHHADGTQDVFYRDSVLTISLHREGIAFYPGTGFINEIGEDAGKGYSVNIPLPPGTPDDVYLWAFNEVVPPLIRRYRPEILLNQFGVDGHYADPLVGLALTTKTYAAVASTMHQLAHEVCNGRYLIVGGGGYDPNNSSRCWTIMFATVSEALPEKSKNDYAPLFDKNQPTSNDRASGEVKETVEKLKKLIFPFHGLNP